MSRTHYEVETWNAHDWHPWCDVDENVIEYDDVHTAFSVKSVLERQGKCVRVMQIFCKQTVIRSLEMLMVAE
jgi:hypothetical protein